MWIIQEVIVEKIWEPGKVVYRSENPDFKHCFEKVSNKPRWIKLN